MKYKFQKAKITIIENEKVISSITNKLKSYEDKSIEYSVEIFLTERELEVLRLIINGMTNREIGDILGISSHTVKAHIKNIFTKLSVHDRIQAVVKAIKEKLI